LVHIVRVVIKHHRNPLFVQPVIIVLLLLQPMEVAVAAVHQAMAHQAALVQVVHHNQCRAVLIAHRMLVVHRLMIVIVSQVYLVHWALIYHVQHVHLD
jgi:hypothetical protein